MAQDASGELAVEGQVEPVKVTAAERRKLEREATNLLGPFSAKLNINYDGGDDITATITGVVSYGERTASTTVPISEESKEGLREYLDKLMDENLPAARRAALSGAAEAITVAMRRGEVL